MLKVVEYGLFAVSLLIVLALILAAPGTPNPLAAEAAGLEAETKLPASTNP